MKNRIYQVAIVTLIVATCVVLNVTRESQTDELVPARKVSMAASLERPLASIDQYFHQTHHLLSRSANQQDSKRSLEKLRLCLVSLPPHEATAAITAYLDSSEDAPTNLGFSMGDGGSLDAWPSLRVALLDWLGQIDRTAAGAYAEKVLETPTHPDEWALSLRNYGWAHPDSESHPYLKSKVEEMITNTEWRENPSAGFLEAFDVFVHTRSTESAPLLAELVSDQEPNSQAVAHAAFLTLDRLTVREPTAVLSELAKLPEITRTHGGMVANFYARADLREPEQRQALEHYLLSPARTARELASFVGVYPNNNRMISKNLLTNVQTPKGSDLNHHDREALVIVTAWLDDPTFDKIEPYIGTMHQRLEAFVGQTEYPGLTQ